MFGFILETEAFDTVLDTTHQSAFVSYCVKHKLVDGLLQFAITNQRYVFGKCVIVKKKTKKH